MLDIWICNRCRANSYGLSDSEPNAGSSFSAPSIVSDSCHRRPRVDHVHFWLPVATIASPNQAAALSHSRSEAEMAAASNELIVGAFPASVDVLVSFDAETIAYGRAGLA